jgi:hypothetical protein
LCSLHPPSGRTGEHTQKGYRSDALVLEGSLLTSIAGFESASQFSRGVFDFTVAHGAAFLVSGAASLVSAAAFLVSAAHANL